MLLFVLSVVLSVISFFPIAAAETQTATIINATFRLTPHETYRQGLGSFHGDENITLNISIANESPVNFTLLTYNGPNYSNIIAANLTYSFDAGPYYYEAAFLAGTTTSTDVHFQVSVEKPAANYDFSWLSTPAKALFLASWAALMFLILKPLVSGDFTPKMENQPNRSILKQKNQRSLKIAILISFIFWIVLLVLNSNPLATFENWYTDAARNSYTSVLFTKVGFKVFSTPLGKLSSIDSSLYKFVTWAEMPNLYPLGSMFLFMPFGALLETGFSQVLVFKMEILLLLAAAHLCLYLFLRQLWDKELERKPRDVYLKPFWRQEFSFLLKALATYLFYIVLVVYAADGQFDAVAFLFCLPAFALFLEERYDLFLFYVVIATTFKYEAGIFLLPLIMLGIIRLLQKNPHNALLRNKAVLAAAGLAAVDLFTAYLSAPLMMAIRPELIMNGVNAFSPHAQLSWSMQAFAVLLTLSVTLGFAAYLLNKSSLISLLMVSSLLPIFTMPYFQPWYLPFFFIFPLIPQPKRSLEVTLVWLVFIVLTLSFGGVSYNPLLILNDIKKIIGF